MSSLATQILSGWRGTCGYSKTWMSRSGGAWRRHHLYKIRVQRAVKRDAVEAGGRDIRTIRELLGRADVSTTIAYTDVRGRGPMGLARAPRQLLMAAR